MNAEFSGPFEPDPMADLVDSMRPVCALALDDDEVAAVLEANGINDRVARRDFDVSSVFSLAAAVLRQSRLRPTGPTSEPTGLVSPAAPLPVLDTLVRGALYLTPTVVAVGAAAHIDGLPTVTTKGALVFGWGVSQALAYLGYCGLGMAGRTAAARVLVIGFGLAAVGWGTVLWLSDVPWPTGFLVSAAQLALFAATAAALVTGMERRVLRWAVPCWLSAGLMAGTAAGTGAGLFADIGLLVSLGVMLLVAYRPVFGPPDPGTGRAWWWPGPSQLFASMGYGTVGTGQAVLFVLVILVGMSSSRLPMEAIPLLLGVPPIELVLLWSQRRAAEGRARLHHRAAFARYLVRVSRGTVASLCVPILVGFVLFVPALTGHTLPFGQFTTPRSQSRLATAVLLIAVYALCLILVTHRRLATAAILVWWPAALIAVSAGALPGWMHLSVDSTDWVTGMTLLATCVPAVAVVTLVIRDPWSYR